MFLIFGTKNVAKDTATGAFFCPHCNCEQPYVQRRVRQHAHLFFIPVVPIDSGQEYVECGGCNGTYKPEVLNFDPAAEDRQFNAEFQDAALKVMVQMMMADGEIHEDEKASIAHVYEKIAGRPMGRDEMGFQIGQVESQNLSLHDRLKDFSYRLNDEGKELVVKAAFMVAAADGVFQEEEKEALGEIAGALQISQAHFKAILDGMMTE